MIVESRQTISGDEHGRRENLWLITNLIAKDRNGGIYLPNSKNSTNSKETHQAN
jgi:hypothetical protein